MRRAAETNVARRSMVSTRAEPRPSEDRRHRSVTPLRSSITLSKPNAVSSTLCAAIPAPMASTASAAIQATVRISSRTPVRTAAARSVVEKTAPLLAVEDEGEILERAQTADRQPEARWEPGGGAWIDEQLGAVLEHDRGVAAEVVAA